MTRRAPGRKAASTQASTSARQCQYPGELARCTYPACACAHVLEAAPLSMAELEAQRARELETAAADRAAGEAQWDREQLRPLDRLRLVFELLGAAELDARHVREQLEALRLQLDGRYQLAADRVTFALALMYVAVPNRPRVLELLTAALEQLVYVTERTLDPL